MLKINSTLFVNENEIIFNFIRSSGPGGQNVNKNSTAVQLRFDILNSSSLPVEVKNKLIKISGTKVSNKGVLIISANRYRTQHKNRSDSINRLIDLLKKASRKPKLRKKTKPPTSLNEERLKTKHKRSKLKKLRRTVDLSSE